MYAWLSVTIRVLKLILTRFNLIVSESRMSSRRRQHRHISGSFTDPQSPSTREAELAINWNICALCQTESSDSLICPAKRDGAGYRYVADNLLAFQNEGLSAISVPISLLDEGQGIEATFRAHSAKWHKRCRSKVDTDKLKRKGQLGVSSNGMQSSPAKTRKHCEGSSLQNSCIFCSENGGELHSVQTLEVDEKVRDYATRLSDRELLRKLAGGDMVALESCYHRACLTRYGREAEKKLNHKSDRQNDEAIHDSCFAETVSYIESFRGNPDTAPVLSMPHICGVYRAKLRKAGASNPEDVHSTRLRTRLLSAIPNLVASVKGREYILLFEEDLGDAITKACKHDSESQHLEKAAHKIRNELFNATNTFDGTFSNDCQEKSVPPSLKALINMIIYGKDNADVSTYSQTVLSISQLVAYHSRRKMQSYSSSVVRNNPDKETPLPLYLSLKIHSETRKKGLVDLLHNLGIGVSYKRVLAITTDIANSLCTRFETEGVVCPQNMVRGQFTVGAVDNVDHNPSSTTSKDSFHGTSISLMQPNCGLDHSSSVSCIPRNTESRCNDIAPLPVSYTDVRPLAMPSTDTFVPPSDTLTEVVIRPEVLGTEREIEWLENCKGDAKEGVSPDALSWSAFHSLHERNVDETVTRIGLLPLLHENAHSAALIRHAMDVVKKTTRHLNPNQPPVLVMDQPLFAIAKEIQWKLPDVYGENQYFVMMGGLHIEMAAFNVLGVWLDGSGWTNAITISGLASSGIANSFLKVSHLTRTRHAHQVTAASLHILQQKAYSEYRGQNALSFDEWSVKTSERQPQFAFWASVLNLQLIVLQMLYSIRTADFTCYKESLSMVVPWMFALDRVNYARWMSVHIRDLADIESKHPELHRKFSEGAFVVRKTTRKFSAIAIDHAHEQCNALVKGEGGAVGLTSNVNALKRWMIAGPEVSRLMKNFEECLPTSKQSQDHHENTESLQRAFRDEVNALVKAFEDLGNPFSEDSGYLYALDSKEIMPKEVVETVKNVRVIGQSKYTEFVKERFLTSSKKISEPIHKNKLPTFSAPGKKSKGTAKTNITALKDDYSLFARLFIACQSRDGDLENFFRHENQPYPPSLSKFGSLRTGDKAQLLPFLLSSAEPRVSTTTDGDNHLPPLGAELADVELEDEESQLPLLDNLADFIDTGAFEEDLFLEEADTFMDVDFSPDYGTPIIDAKVFDGAALVHMKTPGLSKTFEEYADKVLLPFLIKELDHVKRVDVVWDVYHKDSLKASTREKRGSGERRKVEASTLIPRNWRGFLRVSENKEELFTFLAQKVSTVYIPGKTIISTHEQSALASPASTDVSGVSPCSHEEADTRLILHAADCVCNGYERVLVQTVDTDVLVLAVANFSEMHAAELWVAFGTGKHFKMIPVHEIANNLGETTARALPFFHALTGCDTVSFFAGKGKKTALETWRVFPEATEAFHALSKAPEISLFPEATEANHALSRAPDTISDTSFSIIERFVVLLYNRSSLNTNVNDERKALFSRQCRLLEKIPPTQDALIQHTKRAAFQGGHIWGQCLSKLPCLPDPSEWGWKKEKSDNQGDLLMWEPLWTTLPQAEHSCQELTRCSCKKGCTQARCKCKKAGLDCTTLCDCGDVC